MALTHHHHHLSSSPFSFIHTHYPIPNPTPYLSLSLFSKSKPKTQNLFSLFSTPPTSTNSSDSSTHIFLPFLQREELPEPQQQHDKEEEEEEEEEVEEDEDEDEDEEEEDSMIRFFKSRTSSSTQDPQRESKLSFQKNRRPSWHLAPDMESETEPETDVENVIFEEKKQVGHVEKSNSRPLPEGIVGEIVRTARELPGNMTLGEALGGYEKRVSEKHCVEVLGLMSEEGLVMGCLYFFEWMGLQEPSLLTPRACSVLFPVLGRARMGEKLMVLFRNLPPKKEFRDVHVYNAAISGLLCCGRYGILGTLLVVIDFGLCICYRNMLKVL